MANVSIREAGPTISSNQLEEVEQALGYRLPDGYRSFMLANNGGRPTPEFFAIGWNGQEWADGWEVNELDNLLSIGEEESPNLLDNFETYTGRIPTDTLPIGYDPSGNQLLLGVGSANYDKVYFWMQDYEKDESEPGEPDYRNVGFVANSFNAFLDALVEA